jgi:diaminohydroxyphosphoribosylaminopyrimidine deaminase/5-amino-6-(5-phosphoribosylamino)uracil reductase
MSTRFDDPAAVMRHALSLAARGIGLVEPNPPVGAVVVDDSLALLGAGFHERFGGPHAEVHALRDAGERARGAALYVTLEPCCHHGKTPPCTDAVLAAGIRRVVAAMSDPAPHCAGRGFETLRAAGVEVEVGLLHDEAAGLLAPFVKRTLQGLPWVHAKWAMTLDGKLAARTGHSRWISNDESRAVVHALRSRMDAIVVGSETALRDDPLLTARPPGPRHALRVVLDSRLRLPLSAQLVRTARENPVLVATLPDRAASEHADALRAAGIEVLGIPARLSDTLASLAVCGTGIPADDSTRISVQSPDPATAGAVIAAADPPDAPHLDPELLLRELVRRGATHVLVEGGGTLLGSLHDAGLVDELHVFLAPKLVGGVGAPTPVAGLGLPAIPAPGQLADVEIRVLGEDVYVHARIAR